MKQNILITLVQTVAVNIFVFFFMCLFGLWIGLAWLRDHGPKFTRPLFVWLAGKPLKDLNNGS